MNALQYTYRLTVYVRTYVRIRRYRTNLFFPSLSWYWRPTLLVITCLYVCRSLQYISRESNEEFHTLSLHPDSLLKKVRVWLAIIGVQQLANPTPLV